MTRKGELMPQMAEIQRIVCKVFGIGISDLLSERKTRSLMPIRFAAYWLCRKLTSASFPEIAFAFGGRHHTTIMNGIGKAEMHFVKNLDLHLKVAKIVKEWPNAK